MYKDVFDRAFKNARGNIENASTHLIISLSKSLMRVVFYTFLVG